MRTKLPESFIWKANQRLNAGKKRENAPFKMLFSKSYLKITIALCFGWMLMDISYYSIGLFTPDILSALHFATSGNFVNDTKTIVKNTIFVNSFVAVGAFLAIFLIDKMSRIKLQKLGFLGGFVALFVLSISQYIHTIPIFPLLLTCFLTYNLFINMGPDATTYLLPAEIYPTNMKGTGHGLAAGTSKFGAFIGAIFLPKFQVLFGVHATVFILSLFLLLGYFLTNLLKPEKLTYKAQEKKGAVQLSAECLIK